MVFSIVKYLIIFLIAIVGIFFGHISILSYFEIPPFQNFIIYAYLFNYVIASAIVSGLYIIRKKYKDNLASLFLIGSLFKFILFYVVFYPMYKEDGSMSRMEFFTFFIPYFSCLIMEALALILLLRYLDYGTSKKHLQKELK